MTKVDVQQPKISSFETLDTLESVSIKSSKMDEEYEPPTNWRAVIVVAILMFLTGIEAAFTGSSEWPYMHTIDKDASYGFYGIANSVSSWGSLVTTILFSLWCYKFETVKWPLLTGRILAFLGSVLYVCVEMFPSNRRYVMLTCYIIFSIAGSSNVVLRVYMVLISTKADRSRAFAFLAIATLMSIVIGPLVQLAFSSINYPGKQLLPNLRFNLFSAPIWLATVLNFITIFFIFFALPEMPKKDRTEDGGESLGIIGFIKDRWRKIRGLKISWLLVVVIYILRISFQFSVNTIGSVLPVIFMSGYGWDNVLVVRWMSISMGIIGVLSIISSVIVSLRPVAEFLKSRGQLLLMFALITVMLAGTFPYPFLGTTTAEYNSTSGVGCNPEEYSWCGSRVTNVYILLPSVIGCLGISIAGAAIAVDSMYSKVVGEANQSLMQGIMAVLDGLIAIVSPIYSSRIFIARGQSILWICNGAFSIFGFILVLIFFHKMKKY